MIGMILLPKSFLHLDPFGPFAGLNSGTPKSSFLVGFSLINHPFWGSHIYGNHDLESPPWCFTDDDLPWRLGHGAAELLQPLAQLRSLELVAEGALAAQRLPTAASSGAPAAAFLKKHGDTVTRRGTISLLMKMIQRIQSTNGC